MPLEYHKQKTFSGSYNTTIILPYVKSLDQFRQWISTTAKKHGINEVPATVSTCLPYPTRSLLNFFRKRLQILVLDCDDLESMYAAVRILKRDNIQWAGIESSPDHFWIITDKIGTFSELLQILEAIPGVDPDYVKFTKVYERFHLRAISNSAGSPKFGPSDDLRDHRVIDWYAEFQELHKDQLIIENLALIQHLHNGTMAGAAACPNFDV